MIMRLLQVFFFCLIIVLLLNWLAITGINTTETKKEEDKIKSLDWTINNSYKILEKFSDPVTRRSFEDQIKDQEDELKILKNKLLDNQKAEFVRMTGSGSTLVMYFKSKVSAKKALKMYKRKLNKCWCILSKII